MKIYPSKRNQKCHLQVSMQKLILRYYVLMLSTCFVTCVEIYLTTIFRYPTFVDALRDLDDALSMVFLFSSLPQTNRIKVKQIVVLSTYLLSDDSYIQLIWHTLPRICTPISMVGFEVCITRLVIKPCCKCQHNKKKDVLN